MLVEGLGSARPEKQEPPGHDADLTASPWRPARPRRTGRTGTRSDATSLVQGQAGRDSESSRGAHLPKTVACHPNQRAQERRSDVVTGAGDPHRRDRWPSSRPAWVGGRRDWPGTASTTSSCSTSRYLPAAAACWRAAARVRAERTAWRVLAIALLVSASCNASRTLLAGVTGVTGDGSSVSPVIDALSLVAYVLLYVTMVGLIRARVARFHPSMWLDGLIGALGTTAVGVAFLLGPYLKPDAGHTPLPLMDLAWPTSDLLLLGVARRRRRDPRHPARPHPADRDRRPWASC